MNKYLSALKGQDFHAPVNTALSKLPKGLKAVLAVPEMTIVENHEPAKPAANDHAARLATPAEVAELRSLIRAVLADSPDEWDEGHRIACADPEAALTCWRTLAAAMQPAPPLLADDRRTCRQCRNLASNGRCLAAARRELPHIASSRYEPVPDLPRRCEAFTPRSSP